MRSAHRVGVERFAVAWFETSVWASAPYPSLLAVGLFSGRQFTGSLQELLGNITNRVSAVGRAGGGD